MAKYHLNPDLGPMPCKAKQACPYGEDAPHFPTLSAATEAYEGLMAEELPLRPVKKPGLQENLLRRVEDTAFPGDVVIVGSEDLRSITAERQRADRQASETLSSYWSAEPFSAPTVSTLRRLHKRRGLEVLHSVSIEDGELGAKPWCGEELVKPSSVAVATAHVFAAQLRDSTIDEIARAQELVISPKTFTPKLELKNEILSAVNETEEAGDYTVSSLPPTSLVPGGTCAVGVLEAHDKSNRGLLFYGPVEVSSLEARAQAMAMLSASDSTFGLLRHGAETSYFDLNSPFCPGYYEGTVEEFQSAYVNPWLSDRI